MRILITGDLVVNLNYDVTLIDSSVSDLFADSDLNIVNLECPVTPDIGSERIVKTGPHLKGHKTALANVLSSLKVNLVTLANNHILDYGAKGLCETLKFCDDTCTSYVGAGKNLKEARRPFQTFIKGKKISILNIAENEWASASELDAGANPLDIIDNVRDIQDVKKDSDFLIIISHGGHEYYNLPSPRVQKLYRFYADNGADLIVGHHPHCISGAEIYNGVPIWYSLGNFLFTKQSKFDDWYCGIVLEVEIDGRDQIAVRPHFIQQDRTSFALKKIEGNQERALNLRIAEYGEIIRTDLENHWQDYVNRSMEKYQRYWSPASFINNTYVREAMYRVSKFWNKRRGNALFLNLIRCESHRDLSKEFLLKSLKDNDENSDTSSAR